METFENRTAVVTGAASGIGRASAKAFAQLGMSVALLDIRAPELAAVVNEIRALGARAIGVTTDVSETESVEAAALQVEHTFGRVHLVMNNAAVFLRGLRMDVAPDAAWEWIVGVNLYGVIRVVRSFLPLIRAHGQDGHVINTASISGLVVGDRESGAYSATKFAVIAFSEALEHDLKGTGIGVSVLIAGAVSTDFYVNSARSRGSIGGPNRYAETPPDIAAGMKPEEVVRRMLEGVRAGQFFIPTHPETRPAVEARHARLMAAYAFAEDRFKS